MSEQDRPYKPFDSAFKTLIAACPQLLIPLVNELFGTTFTREDKVVLMDSKQMKPIAMGKISTREVDSLFAIDGERRMMFHIECQSTTDDTMVARFWEYDAHIALMNAEITEGGRMRVRFPRSAVLYLRHNANTPDKLTIEIENDKGIVFDIHEIPVIKTQRYDLDELFRKNLLFLFPFYAFRHEKMLAEYDADEDKFAILRDDLARMIKHLDDERDAGRIDGVILRALRVAIISILRGLGGEHANVMKGVNGMLEGQILDVDAFRIHDKAWDEGEAKGREEGRAEGILSTLFGLVRKGRLTVADASSEAGLTTAAFNAKMAEYEARPAQTSRRP